MIKLGMIFGISNSISYLTFHFTYTYADLENAEMNPKHSQTSELSVNHADRLSISENWFHVPSEHAEKVYFAFSLAIHNHQNEQKQTLAIHLCV